MRTIYSVTLLLSTCVSAAGHEPPGKETNLRQLIDKSVHWYQLFPELDSADAMKPVVLLRWPNNLRGSPDGATVAWIANGRPEAVASVYPWAGEFFVQFDSLSRGTLVAKLDGNVVWSPNAAGVDFHEASGVPAPAQSRMARLRQMKSIAKQCGATFLGWQEDDSEREQLRLMPSPLHRYEITKPDTVLDGALFAFATGTDPEALLIVEAFGKEGTWRWQYGFVRQSSAKLEGRFRDKVVWTVDRYPETHDPRSTYIQFSRPLDDVLTPED